MVPESTDASESDALVRLLWDSLGPEKFKRLAADVAARATLSSVHAEDETCASARVALRRLNDLVAAGQNDRVVASFRQRLREQIESVACRDSAKAKTMPFGGSKLAGLVIPNLNGRWSWPPVVDGPGGVRGHFLIVEEAFMPAGQGLFAAVRVFGRRIDQSGRAVASDRAVVYDCGSLRRETIESAVDWFSRSMSSRIDAVVLSHLDKDHVNGIRALATRLRPRVVILPYVKPSIRAIRALGAGRISQFGVRLLVQPVRTLQEELGIPRVVVLVPGEESSSGPLGEDQPNASVGEDGLRFPPVSREEAESVTADLVGLSPGNVFRAAGNVEFDLFYRFRLFSLPPSPVASAVERAVEGLFASWGKSPRVTEDVASVLASREARAILRGRYRSALRGWRGTDVLNRSSIVMIHYPLRAQGVPYRVLLEGTVARDALANPVGAEAAAPRGLLLGDLCLRGCVDALRRGLRPDLSGFSTLSAPHHGARANWDPGILNHSGDKALVVASARPDKHHPCPDVEAAVGSHPHRLTYRLADRTQAVVSLTFLA